MPAANTDHFTHVGQPGTATSLAAPGHTIGGTSINVVATANWPTDTGVVFAMDTYTVVNGKAVRDANSYTEWEGVVSSGTVIGSMTLLEGNDQNYPAGATSRVYIPVASSFLKQLVDGILVAHNQDGTHKSGAAYPLATIASFVNAHHDHSNSAGGGGVSVVAASNPSKFSVYRSGAINTGNAAFAVIPYDNEVLDTGSDVAAGVFTARFTGVHGFAWMAQIVAAAGNEEFVASLFVNGVRTYDGLNFKSAAAGDMSSIGSIPLVHLTIGDTVDIRAFDGLAARALDVGASNNYFMGEFKYAS